MPLPTGRARGKVACPGPHDTPAYRELADYLCAACWWQLSPETRRRLKLSGGSGRIEPVVRLMELRQQLEDGVPLNRIEVTQ